MAYAIKFNKEGERRYESGVSQCVLYVMRDEGGYEDGVAWNGITNITETPSGAETTSQYADNVVYVNIPSAEKFGAKIEAFTYPDEFAKCDGSASVINGVVAGQQPRKPFGLFYRTEIGTDKNDSAGFKLHLIFSAKAGTSERSYSTINESVDTAKFSWELSTIPMEIDGLVKPASLVTIDSTKIDAQKLKKILEYALGTDDGEGNVVNGKMITPEKLKELIA